MSIRFSRALDYCYFRSEVKDGDQGFERFVNNSGGRDGVFFCHIWLSFRGTHDPPSWAGEHGRFKFPSPVTLNVLAP